MWILQALNTQRYLRVQLQVKDVRLWLLVNKLMLVLLVLLVWLLVKLKGVSVLIVERKLLKWGLPMLLLQVEIVQLRLVKVQIIMWVLVLGQLEMVWIRL